MHVFLLQSYEKHCEEFMKTVLSYFGYGDLQATDNLFCFMLNLFYRRKYLEYDRTHRLQSGFRPLHDVSM